MPSRDEILQLIYSAFDSVNDMYEDDQKINIPKAEGSLLFGPDSAIDSLSLINLVVAIEESLEEKYDTEITLADDRAMSQAVSPFHSFESLADYVLISLKEANA
jgi:acyl carrier protein